MLGGGGEGEHHRACWGRGNTTDAGGGGEGEHHRCWERESTTDAGGGGRTTEHAGESGVYHSVGTEMVTK